jgi:predicted nucleic acid-binding protein
MDTSAVLALLNAKDRAHRRATRAFASLREREAVLVTTSFVLVETYALLGRRLGLEAVRSFRDDFSPLLEIVWVGEELCERGLDLLLQRGRPALSLVDAVSFIVLTESRVEEVFAYDRDFEAEGFAVVS